MPLISVVVVEPDRADVLWPPCATSPPEDVEVVDETDYPAHGVGLLRRGGQRPQEAAARADRLPFLAANAVGRRFEHRIGWGEFE